MADVALTAVDDNTDIALLISAIKESHVMAKTAILSDRSNVAQFAVVPDGVQALNELGRITNDNVRFDVLQNVVVFDKDVYGIIRDEYKRLQHADEAAIADSPIANTIEYQMLRVVAEKVPENAI